MPYLAADLFKLLSVTPSGYRLTSVSSGDYPWVSHSVTLCYQGPLKPYLFSFFWGSATNMNHPRKLLGHSSGSSFFALPSIHLTSILSDSAFQLPLLSESIPNFISSSISITDWYMGFHLKAFVLAHPAVVSIGGLPLNKNEPPI